MSIGYSKIHILKQLLAAVGLGVAANVSAQDDHALFGMSLEELLNVPVKSATLTELDILSAPSSISLFHHQQFELMGVDYLHELINFVPGFQAFRQGDGPNEYYISARGRRTGSSNREILVLVDGQRQNRDFDGALAVPVILLAGVEKIEFIRGPGSALYGSNAFMGVIDITTKKGVNRIESSLSTGDAGTKIVHAQASYAVSNWTLNAQLTGLIDEGQRYNVADTFTGLPTTITDPHSGTSLRLSASSNNTSVTFVSERRRSKNFYIPDTTAEGTSRTINPVDGLSLSHRWQAAPDLTVNFSSSYSHLAYEAQLFIAPVGALAAVSSPSGTDPFIIQLEQPQRNLVGAVQGDWQWQPDISFQGGVEWRKGHYGDLRVRNNYDLTALANGDYPIAFYGDEERYSYVYHAFDRTVLAGYLQAQAKLNDDWALTVGGRYDRYSSSGSAYSPRLALVRTLTANQSLKLLYGEAFRAPTINELAAENNIYVTGNPQLDSERVSTLELVWVGAWERRQLSVSMFQNQFKDGIFQRVMGNNRIFANSQNEESASGAELGYFEQLSDYWQVRASASHVFTPLDEGFRLADTTGSVTVNYQKSKWNLNVGWVFTGEREQVVPSGDRLTLDSYQWFTAKVRYQWAKNRDLWLQVKNAADTNYQTPAQSESLEYGLPNRGRELSLGLSLGF
ncbi:TonB-dependent receptor plug domain-containing protein [Saccharophagus degradans]|uniref:TonB-dependent receptor n=1 Tax=Saccharophagus degradans (strain 2-40 / ATCC 43961 / DSM 17024) TaxID=203122 RepID=Q21NF5_SACD2|nr:TonB-dependent receptor [Saccharophagus degradans]ABD79774.1 TonB-dependent receptor [Saccharophagus degradans 2-40]